MQTELLRRQLRELMETLREQFESMQENTGSIPRIELDILMNTTRKFYDKLTVLQRLNEPRIPENHVHPDIPMTSSDPLPVDPLPKVTPVSRPEIKNVELPRSASRKTEDPDRKAIKESVGDLFANEEPSFSIRLKEARDQSLPRKPEKPGHLKILIGINDKFLFINELFDGALKEYNEAIEKLNGCQDSREALEMLEELRLKNLWEFSSPTFQKLKGILEEFYP